MYLVFAYRYGELTGYHFPVGCFETLEQANWAANNHRTFRGGKYEHRIWEMKLNEEYDAGEAHIVQEVNQ